MSVVGWQAEVAEFSVMGSQPFPLPDLLRLLPLPFFAGALKSPP